MPSSAAPRGCHRWLSSAPQEGRGAACTPAGSDRELEAPKSHPRAALEEFRVCSCDQCSCHPTTTHFITITFCGCCRCPHICLQVQGNESTSCALALCPQHLQRRWSPPGTPLHAGGSQGPSLSPTLAGNHPSTALSVPGSCLAGVTATRGCSNAAVNQTLGVLFKYKHIESVLFV